MRGADYLLNSGEISTKEELIEMQEQHKYILRVKLADLLVREDGVLANFQSYDEAWNHVFGELGGWTEERMELELVLQNIEPSRLISIELTGEKND